MSARRDRESRGVRVEKESARRKRERVEKEE